MRSCSSSARFIRSLLGANVIIVRAHARVLGLLRTSTPGRALPSSHSRKAPPGRRDIRQPPHYSRRVESRNRIAPPATDRSLPAWVSSAAASAIPMVAVQNGTSSNAPTGPFQTRVLAWLRADNNAVRCSGARGRGSCLGTDRLGPERHARGRGPPLLGHHHIYREQQRPPLAAALGRGGRLSSAVSASELPIGCLAPPRRCSPWHRR